MVPPAGNVEDRRDLVEGLLHPPGGVVVLPDGGGSGCGGAAARTQSEDGDDCTDGSYRPSRYDVHQRGHRDSHDGHSGSCYGQHGETSPAGGSSLCGFAAGAVELVVRGEAVQLLYLLLVSHIEFGIPSLEGGPAGILLLRCPLEDRPAVLYVCVQDLELGGVGVLGVGERLLPLDERFQLLEVLRPVRERVGVEAVLIRGIEGRLCGFELCGKFPLPADELAVPVVSALAVLQLPDAAGGVVLRVHQPGDAAGRAAASVREQRRALRVDGLVRSGQVPSAGDGEEAVADAAVLQTVHVPEVLGLHGVDRDVLLVVDAAEHRAHAVALLTVLGEGDPVAVLEDDVDRAGIAGLRGRIADLGLREEGGGDERPEGALARLVGPVHGVQSGRHLHVAVLQPAEGTYPDAEDPHSLPSRILLTAESCASLTRSCSLPCLAKYSRYILTSLEGAVQQMASSSSSSLML